jgi:hypothetical protein
VVFIIDVAPPVEGGCVINKLQIRTSPYHRSITRSSLAVQSRSLDATKSANPHLIKNMTNGALVYSSNRWSFRPLRYYKNHYSGDRSFSWPEEHGYPMDPSYFKTSEVYLDLVKFIPLFAKFYRELTEKPFDLSQYVSVVSKHLFINDETKPGLLSTAWWHKHMFKHDPVLFWIISFILEESFRRSPISFKMYSSTFDTGPVPKFNERIDNVSSQESWSRFGPRRKR